MIIEELQKTGTYTCDEELRKTTQIAVSGSKHGPFNINETQQGQSFQANLNLFGQRL
jgi:hypothetical protein